MTRDEAVEDFIKISNDEILPNTAKSYYTSLAGIYKLMFESIWNYRDMTWLDDTDKVLNFIRSHWSNFNTQRAYILRIASVLKRFPESAEAYKVYTVQVSKSNEAYTKNKQDNALSYEDRLKIVPWEKILKARPYNIDKLKKILFILYQQRPRRINTYRVLQWRTKHNPEGNYLIIEDNKLYVVIQSYKSTAYKNIGNQTYEITGYIKDVVRKYVKGHSMADGDHFFQQKRSSKVMCKSAFAKLLADTSGLVLGQRHRNSSRAYRVAKASYISKQRMSINDMIYEANALGHSLPTMMLYSKLNL